MGVAERRDRMSQKTTSSDALTANATSPSNDSKKSRRLWNIVGVPLVSLPLVFLAGSAAIGIDMCRSSQQTSLWQRYGTKIEFQNGTLKRWPNGRYKTGIVSNDFEFVHKIGNLDLHLKVPSGKTLNFDSGGNIDFNLQYSEDQPVYTEAILATAIKIQNIDIPAGTGIKVETDGNATLFSDELTIPYQKHGGPSLRLRGTSDKKITIKLDKNGHVNAINGLLAEDVVVPYKLGETILKIRLPEKLPVAFNGTGIDLVESNRNHDDYLMREEHVSLAEPTALDSVRAEKGTEVYFEQDGCIKLFHDRIDVQYPITEGTTVLNLIRNNSDSGIGGNQNRKLVVCFDNRGKVREILEAVLAHQATIQYQFGNSIGMDITLATGTPIKTGKHGIEPDWEWINSNRNRYPSLVNDTQIYGIGITKGSDIMPNPDGSCIVYSKRVFIPCITENDTPTNVELQGNQHGMAKLVLNINGELQKIENAVRYDRYERALEQITFEHESIRGYVCDDNGDCRSRRLRINNLGKINITPKKRPHSKRPARHPTKEPEINLGSKEGWP
ncbi:hypothetical protein KKG55_04820 [Candidatus Micrarchaeota archaeon]|nr:hypothetical protein [Candidatus Micrarchaeota archaeon]